MLEQAPKLIPTRDQRDRRLGVLDHIGSEERPIQSAGSNAAEQQNASPRHSSRLVCMIHEPTAN